MVDPDGDESGAGLLDGGEGPTNLDDIVAGFCVPAPTFPIAALQAAARARDRINDRLLGLIADTHRAALEGRIDPSNGHIFAMLLLAHFEDPRAFDVIANFFSLPEATLDSLVSSFLTEDLGRVLASVCDGRIERLGTLVEDRSRDQYVRGAALSAVAALVQRRKVTHDDAADYLRQLFRGRLEHAPSAVWNEAGNLALDLYVEDLFEEVRDAIRRGLIDQFAIGPSDIDRTIREGRETALAYLDAKPHHRPVLDVVAETRWWHCFQADTEERAEGDGVVVPYADLSHKQRVSPVATVRRASAKVGRNDPCPCGSGKKYKRCCLQKS